MVSLTYTLSHTTKDHKHTFLAFSTDSSHSDRAFLASKLAGSLLRLSSSAVSSELSFRASSCTRATKGEPRCEHSRSLMLTES
jgi:hypothetical protein